MTRPVWLVTGASGFLGANLALGIPGLRVGISRQAPPAGLFDEWHRADLGDSAELIRRLRPAVVINGAALSSHEACEVDPALAVAVNATAAGAAASAAAEIGARFVQISTDAVFAGDRGGYREIDEPEPFSQYGASKLLGEQAVLDAHPSALVIRTNFFGWSPSGSRSILEFFLGRLRAGEPMLGYSDFVVTSIYAGQLVSVICGLVEAEATGVVHVASSDALAKLDFGRLVASTFGLDAGLISPALASAGEHVTARSRDLSLDTTRAAGILERPMPSQASGLEAAQDAEASIRDRFSAH